jgi:hypothetical protein
MQNMLSYPALVFIVLFVLMWLMALMAICANPLVGYGARALSAGAGLLLVVPLVVSLSFTLIADIDSPRGGMIRVKPLNLQALADSLRPY